MNTQPSRNNRAAAIRGLLLVLVAVVVGVLLLRSSSDDSSAEPPATTQPPTQPGETVPTATTISVTQPTTAVPAATTAPASTVPNTTTPPVEGFSPRPAAEVTVQVANSTNVSGAAGRLTDRLKALNYVTGSPTNMRGTPLEKTRIFYQSGSLLEAQLIAEVLGLDRSDDVAKIFADTAAISNFETPDVLVALGLDLAS